MFDPYNRFWRGIARCVDVFGLSFCFVFCSLPLLSASAAATALYDSVYHGIRRGENGVFARFFRTFIRELRPTLPLSAFGAALLLLRRAVLGFAAMEGAAGILACAVLVLMLLPLAVWLFAVFTLSRFSLGRMQLLRVAVRLVFIHLPSAAAVTAIALIAWRTMMWWYFSLFFLPALAVLLMSFIMERIFAPYLRRQEQD